MTELTGQRQAVFEGGLLINVIVWDCVGASPYPGCEIVDAATLPGFADKGWRKPAAPGGKWIPPVGWLQPRDDAGDPVVDERIDYTGVDVEPLPDAEPPEA